MCSGPRAAARGGDAAARPHVSAPSPRSSASAASPAAPVAAAALSVRQESEHPSAPPELAHFSSALAGLEQQTRGDSVRILWFGDSHTAADYLTGAVRSALSRRYGSGGPGFVRLGVSAYRHELATLNRSGRFKIEPEPPARRSQQGDGVFGLGGMRATALEPGRMTLKLSPFTTERVRYSLLFELTPGAAFSVTLGAQTFAVDSALKARRVPESPISRLDFEGANSDPLSIETRLGQPRFYGVVIEGARPGVVLDTLGIDGARIATALAWAEAPFQAEVRARRPDLVVFAYGTNEAFDGLNVEAYDAELNKLLDRVKRAAPAADCLVLGPPDSLSKTGEAAPRVASISAVYARVAAQRGCGFVSLQALMGGPGSFASWQRQEPALARADRVHFTALGYRRLGELLAVAAFGASPAAVAKNSP